MAHGNGRNIDESWVHLVAALHGKVTEVFTTMYDGVTSLLDLVSALKSDLAWNSKVSLLRLSLHYENGSPTKPLQNWGTIFATWWGLHTQAWEYLLRNVCL